MPDIIFTPAPCTCAPDQTPGTYRVGCPRHIAEEAARPPIARVNVASHTVTYYHASVVVSRPIMRDGEVWWTQEYHTCKHNHVTPEAAEECGVTLGNKAKDPFKHIQRPTVQRPTIKGIS